MKANRKKKEKTIVVEPHILPEISIEPKYTCGVVIHKGEDLLSSSVCDAPASDVISVADDTQTKVADVLFVCGDHSKRLEQGESFMVRTIHEKFVLIRLTPKDEQQEPTV